MPRMSRKKWVEAEEELNRRLQGGSILVNRRGVMVYDTQQLTKERAQELGDVYMAVNKRRSFEVKHYHSAYEYAKSGKGSWKSSSNE